MQTRNVAEIFPRSEKISIEFAFMKPAAEEELVFTHPADICWSDLGHWQSVHEKLTKDANNNASVSDVHFYKCSNCVVRIVDAKKVVI